MQNELTLEQNLEIVEAFIQKVLPNHYYTYAVHDKIGMMSDGTHNLHVHLMFSPRVIDGIEQSKERTPRMYFQYPLRKSAKDQSFKNRRSHGVPMDREQTKKSFVFVARAAYAETTNDILEKYGKSARIDHRSLKYQKQKAETEVSDARKKVIDLPRARKMAENSFVHGAYKKLRMERQQLKKNFSAEKEAELKQWQAQLDERIATPFAQERIAEVTAAILQDNQLY